MTDPTIYTPFDSDAAAPTPDKPGAAVLGGGDFRYLGIPMDLREFQSYITGYNFGSVPPDYIVFHHTAIPDASWAPLSADPLTKWDRNEAGLSDSQVRRKRGRQLDGIRNYYRDQLGWDRGPHLFIDDRYIWLFTPMYDVGIHAAEGNSYRDSRGRLHYSIGIEVIGYYAQRTWPAPVERNVGMAVAMLRRRLGTFDLKYTPSPKGKPQNHRGQLSSHRDYNKPECPGAAITEAYYVGVCQRAWAELVQS